MECHTKKGCTPFHLACKEGHLEIAIQLLEKGADTEVTKALTVLLPIVQRPCVLFCCSSVFWTLFFCLGLDYFWIAFCNQCTEAQFHLSR